jgi:ribonucleotide monophosphatase NagD (HAD superfamily)
VGKKAKTICGKPGKATIGAACDITTDKSKFGFSDKNF